MVEELANAIVFRPGQAAVHCAGALPVSTLDNALNCGAVTGGFHPLQTFPTVLGPDDLKRVSFGVEARDEELLGWLERLAVDLGGTAIRLTDGARGAYHASAVMTSCLSAGLIGVAANLWRQFGYSRSEALDALVPLLEATAAQIGSVGIPDGITGPYVRGDVDSVRAHLKAMAGEEPAVLRGYAALALAQLPIVAETGGMARETRSEMEELLGAALAAPK